MFRIREVKEMELSVRAAYRGQVTKVVKSALDFLKDDSSQLSEANADKFDVIKEELVSLLHRLTAADENLNKANADVQQKGLIKPDDPIEKVAEYQDQAIGALARLNTRLEKLRQKQNPELVATQLCDANTTIHTKQVNSASKLPKLPLKRFDGSFHDWLPFWEQFRSPVHENAALSSTEKFNYFESVLIGDAKKTIAGFTPSEKCYEAAASLLQEQYGNSEKLIDKHIHQLVSLTQVRDRTDATGLRHLYGSVIARTRSLTALQVPTNHYYVMLRSILLRCLPTELRIDYHRQVEREEELEQTVRPSNASESSASISQFGGDEVKNILRFFKRTKSKPVMSTTMGTASCLVVVNESDKCLFCKGKSHKTKDYTEGKTL